MNNIQLKAKAKKVKIAIFDVDGVMTDGSLTFDENGVEYKTYNAKDGQGIELLHKAGIIPAIISKRNNGTVTHRAKVLGITELYIGQKHKLDALEEIVKKYGVSYDEIAYMGDDVPDVCVLKLVGLPCCPSDAVEEVKNVSKFVASKSGGKGAVRELTDFILKTKGYELAELIDVQAKIKCGT